MIAALGFDVRARHYSFAAVRSYSQRLLMVGFVPMASHVQRHTDYELSGLTGSQSAISKQTPLLLSIPHPCGVIVEGNNKSRQPSSWLTDARAERACSGGDRHATMKALRLSAANTLGSVQPFSLHALRAASQRRSAPVSFSPTKHAGPACAPYWVCRVIYPKPQHKLSSSALSERNALITNSAAGMTPDRAEDRC